MTLEYEEHLFHFMRMRGVPLSGLDVHDGKREAARRDRRRIAVLARAAGADEAVLRALIPLDLRVLECRPVRLAVAEARDIARRDFFQRKVRDFGRTRMTSDAHELSLLYFIVP